LSTALETFRDYESIINDLHATWTPHAGQVKCGRALFQDDKRTVFIQCGRKWGKTEIIMYFLYRWALVNPGSACYYISPFQKQSKEIIWANGRLQTFVPRKYISSINNTEMRITLTNGSFIKCDGSDNYEAYRGIEPHMVVYEEFKDFRPEFHVAMDPNLSVHNAPLVIIGTPPNVDCQFTDMAKECRTDPEKFFIEEPTESNPHINKGWLHKKKMELIARGEEDVWMREYMGKYMKGGSSKIFPMITDAIKIPHPQLMKLLRPDIKKLTKYIIADPAGASVFGVLFAMINPYTKIIYLLDEIYESRQGRMTVDSVGSRILEKRNEFWHPRSDSDWHFGHDEAATWWANELRDRFGVNSMPTAKAMHKKEDGLSLIKDILLYGKLIMSDRCEKTFWELDNYIKDAKGNIPKVNDHQIDNLRYLLGADLYDLVDVSEATPRENSEDYRGSTIKDDFPNLDSFGRMDNDSDIEHW
jgi:hypothetical protein